MKSRAALRPPQADETNILMPDRVQSILLICTQQWSFAAQFRDLKSFVPRRVSLVAIGGHLLAMCPGAIRLYMSQQRLMSPGVIRNKLNILDAKHSCEQDPTHVIIKESKCKH